VQELTIYLKQHSRYLKCEKKKSKAYCVALIEQKRNIAILLESIAIYSIASSLIIKSISKLLYNVNDKTSRKKS